MKTLFVVMVASCMGWSQQRDLPEVPSGDELENAQKEVRQLFAKDLAETDESKRRTLGQKLLAEAARTQGEPASRYALIVLASRVAASCGEMLVAAKAIEVAESTFRNVPGDKLRMEAVIIARKACTKPTDLVALTGVYIQVFDASIAKEDYEHAAMWAKEALTVARASRGRSALEEAMKMTLCIKDFKEAQEKAEKSKIVIGLDPNHPEASMDIGIYLLMKGEKPTAFLMLANSKSEQVREAVEAESEYGGRAELALGVADKWIAASKTFRGYTTRAMKKQALHILNQSAPKLEGLQKTRVMSRIERLTGRPNCHPLVGEWTMEHPLHGTRIATIRDDGTISAGNLSGKWEIVGGTLKLRWDQLAGSSGSEWMKEQSKLRWAGRRIHMCIFTRK